MSDFWDDALDAISKKIEAMTPEEIFAAVKSIKNKSFEKSNALDHLVYAWQPIDYSQAESGRAPFDGDEYLLKMCDGYVGGAFVLGTWMAGICDAWYTVLGVIPKENVCEWMPVPEFMKGTP